ncbi:MAG: DUF4469 domain-containing protein [Marinifilaceae bacterium]
MPIPFILRKNYLTERKDDYTAKPVTFDSLNQEQLVKKVVERHSSLNEADALIAVRAYESIIAEELKAGHNIVTPMCNIRLSISGVFDREVTEFDPVLHRLKLNYTPGIDFKKIPEQIELVKISAAEVLPVIEFFEDTTTKTQNEKISPGGAAKISGSKLKVNEADTDEGVFFIAQDDTSYRVTTFLRNMPSDAIFMIPETLTPGKYHLQVRSKMDGKTLRIGELDFELTVE